MRSGASSERSKTEAPSSRGNNRPLDLVVLVEDLHVVVLQPQVGVTQPVEGEERGIHQHLGCVCSPAGVT